MKKVVTIARCNTCQKAHQVQTRMVDKQQSVKFICRCGNRINGQYNAEIWEFNGATISERKEGEPVFVHEPELI